MLVKNKKKKIDYAKKVRGMKNGNARESRQVNLGGKCRNDQSSCDNKENLESQSKQIYQTYDLPLEK